MVSTHNDKVTMLLFIAGGQNLFHISGFNKFFNCFFFNLLETNMLKFNKVDDHQNDDRHPTLLVVIQRVQICKNSNYRRDKRDISQWDLTG